MEVLIMFELNYIKTIKFSSSTSNHTHALILSKKTPDEFNKRIGTKYPSGVLNQYLADLVITFSTIKSTYLKSFLLSSEITYDIINDWCLKNCECRRNNILDDYFIIIGAVTKNRSTVCDDTVICCFNNKKDILTFKLTFGDYIYADVRLS